MSTKGGLTTKARFIGRGSVAEKETVDDSIRGDLDVLGVFKLKGNRTASRVR